MPPRRSDSKPKVGRAADADMQALEVSLAMLRHAVDEYALRHRAELGRPGMEDDADGADSAPSVPPPDLGTRIVGRLRIIATTLLGRGRRRH